MADEKDPDEIDRDAILERRRRFISMAVGGFASASLLATGCGDCTPSPCLSMAEEDQQAIERERRLREEAESRACLSVSRMDRALAEEAQRRVEEARRAAEQAERERDEAIRRAREESAMGQPRPCLSVPRRPEPEPERITEEDELF